MKLTEQNNGASKGNGIFQYQPAKTWEHLTGDIWLEEDEEVPGQTKITDSDDVLEELGTDDLGEDN